jgi:Domain of unknown function (DUF4430)
VRRTAFLTLAVALLLAGCGLGPGKKLPGGAQLSVTRDFGQVPLYSARVGQLRQGETVMRLLESKRRVKTSYGGGFVDSIDGLSSSTSVGRSDWFYFVNGVEASVGAAERTLSQGDVVQWDYRRWDATMHVPAIVGAFPEPFLRGTGGKRLPLRVECEQPTGAACKTVMQRLSDAGVPTSSAVLGSSLGAQELRVVVARWSAARQLRGVVSSLSGGPATSGVFARFSADGRTLWLENELGKNVRAAPADTGLVAATATEGGPPVWIITGLDEAGIEAAARALDARTLRDAFAIAVTPSGPLRLPLRTGSGA